MEREGMVSRAESVLMVEPRHLDQLLHPMFEGEQPCKAAKAILCVHASTGHAAAPRV